MSEAPFVEELENPKQPQGTRAVGGYNLTPDEIRSLRECNRESFYYRCLPFASVFSAATFYAVRYGYLKGSVRFGPAPKVLVAATFGYFLGKFSYQHKCAEKLMELPNSPLGQMIRKQKDKRFGGFTETLTLEPSFSTVTTGGPPPPPRASTEFSGSDDSFSTSQYLSDVSDVRPVDSFDFSDQGGSYHENEAQMREESLPPKAEPQYFTSYDALRKKNREEYERAQFSSSLQGIGPGGDTPPQQQNQRHEIQQRSNTPYPNNQSGSMNTNSNSNYARKNTYGDLWDDKAQ